MNSPYISVYNMNNCHVHGSFPENPSVGDLTYQGNSIYVFDNNKQWHQLNLQPESYVSPDIDKTVDWVRPFIEMNEQVQSLHDTVEQHTNTDNEAVNEMVRDALANINDAINQLEVAIKLTRNID